MVDNTPLPFAVGEAVVYPNQGLCNVVGIEEKEVANQTLLFVHLVRQLDGAKVLVPTDKALRVGLRKVATPAEVSSMLEFLKSDSDKASLDWKTRARINTEHMARGNLMGLAEVVKALQVLSELRPLPGKERELYNTARGLLVEEMAVALGMELCDVEDTVDLVLFPLGKTRPRRTVEEFRMAMGTPLEGDLLSFDEDAFLDDGGGGDDDGDGDADDDDGDDDVNDNDAYADSDDLAPDDNSPADDALFTPAATPAPAAPRKKTARKAKTSAPRAKTAAPKAKTSAKTKKETSAPAAQAKRSASKTVGKTSHSAAKRASSSKKKAI